MWENGHVEQKASDGGRLQWNPAITWTLYPLYHVLLCCIFLRVRTAGFFVLDQDCLLQVSQS